MTSIIHRLFPPAPAKPVVPPGLYHRMQADLPGPPRRLHLRVEPDGRGLLIVNASTVLHMNETAAAHAWLLIQGNSEDEAAKWMADRFRLSPGRAMKDGRLVRDQIEALASGEDIDPVVVMGMERAQPYAGHPKSPYRLDLALTYRMPAGQAVGTLARRRAKRELRMDQWLTFLDHAWDSGVPHVVFVGGEPTLRPDLAALVAHAEGLGQVSGVVTAGERLVAARPLDRLAAAGLDHLLVVVDPRRPRSLQGLRRAVASDVFCAAHWTLDPKPTTSLPVQLRKIRDTGVTHISLSAPPKPGHEKALASAQQALAEAGLTLIWDLPVPFASTNPTRLEAGLAPEAGAWLYVEPDGDVVRSIETGEVLGNVTRDSIAGLWRRAGDLARVRGN